MSRISSALRSSSPRSPWGPPSTSPSSPITSPEPLATAITQRLAPSQPRRRVAYAAPRGALAPEHLPHAGAGARSHPPPPGDAAGGRLTGGVALLRPRPPSGIAFPKIEDHRTRHQRNHANGGRPAEPPPLKPAHDAVRGRKSEGAPTRQQHCGRPLGVRERRQRLQLTCASTATAHLHRAPGPHGSDDHRAARAGPEICPMSDREALGQRKRIAHRESAQVTWQDRLSRVSRPCSL